MSHSESEQTEKVSIGTVLPKYREERTPRKRISQTKARPLDGALQISFGFSRKEQNFKKPYPF